MAKFEDFSPIFCPTADFLPKGGPRFFVKYSPVLLCMSQTKYKLTLFRYIHFVDIYYKIYHLLFSLNNVVRFPCFGYNQNYEVFVKNEKYLKKVLLILFDFNNKLISDILWMSVNHQPPICQHMKMCLRKQLLTSDLKLTIR